MSKGYTINYFINELNGVTTSTFNSNNVYTVVSPRYGKNSVKAEALDTYLGGRGKAASVANGTGRFSALGKTPRARLLKALRNRKKFGTVLV